jgi:hypothetical protein
MWLIQLKNTCSGWIILGEIVSQGEEAHLPGAEEVI